MKVIYYQQLHSNHYWYFILVDNGVDAETVPVIHFITLCKTSFY